MKATKLALVAAVALASSAAMANVVTDTAGSAAKGVKSLFKTASNPAAVSIEAGTLGYGANIAWGVNEKTEIQAGWAGGDLLGEAVGDIDVDNINYSLEQDFNNPYLGVQLRPAGNWLTVGTGVLVQDNKFKLKANPKAGATYEINNVNVSATEFGALTGVVEYKNALAPYLTIGFRPNINNRFGVFAEVGAAYTGKPQANIYSSKSDDTVLPTNSTYNTVGDARTEANKELNREINKSDAAEWYPIVKLGATVRF